MTLWKPARALKSSFSHFLYYSFRAADLADFLCQLLNHAKKHLVSYSKTANKAFFYGILYQCGSSQ